MIESKLMRLAREGNLPHGTTLATKANVALQKKLITKEEHDKLFNKQKPVETKSYPWQRTGKRLLDQDIKPWMFISVERRARDAATLAGRLPPISGIAGVPRSGVSAAGIISEILHVPLYEASLQYGLRPMGHGGRGNTTNVDPDAPILILEDSVCSGGSMRKMKQRLGRGNYLYASIYGNEPGLSELDFYGSQFDQPHLLEWNLGNTFYLHSLQPGFATGGDGIVVDFDGVLCPDPPRFFDETNPEDRAEYLDWIANAPLGTLIPKMHAIRAIVSYRCEYTREVSEKWLKTRGIQYDELILWDGPPESRIWDCVHKAKVFASKNYGLFIESAEDQSLKIAELTGKPVLCWDKKETIFPQDKVGTLRTEHHPKITIKKAKNRKITSVVAVTALSLKKHSVERQTLCLDSWKQFGLDIVAKNTRAEIEQLKPLYHQVSQWIPEDELSVGFYHPTQLISNLISTAVQLGKPIFLMNSDIELYGKASDIVPLVKEGQSVLGQRWDYTESKDYAKESRLGIDLVSFTPKQAKLIPKLPCAIGGPFWDYIVPLYLQRAGVKLKFLHKPMLFHEEHPIKWDHKSWMAMHEFMVLEFGVSVIDDQMAFHKRVDPRHRYEAWRWIPDD